MKVVYIKEIVDAAKGLKIPVGTIKKYSEDVANDLIRTGCCAPINDKADQVKKQREEEIFEDIYETAVTLSNKGILFDESGVIWKYDPSKYSYKFCDLTDISNIIAEEVSIFSALNPLYRVAFEKAIKMAGRDKASVICKDASSRYKYSVQFLDTLYNGVSLEQKKVTCEDFVHNSIPYAPKEKETKRIDELFNQWTNGKAAQLKDIIAYSCIPNNTQKLIFFYLGPRNSGKSQFMGVLKQFLGESNCISTNLGILADQGQRFELINLRNKLAAFVSEIDEKTTYNTAILKRLSGNDDIRGEYKGINGSISFRFGGKVHIITNSLPTVADENDYAYFARTVIIDFPNTFQNTDIEVLDTIPSEEYEGLAHYCLSRIKEWYQNKSIKISDLEPVDLRAKKYLERTDYLGGFVSRYMEMHEDFEEDTQYKINSNELASMFNEYLIKNGQKEWDARRIGRALFEKYPKQIERQKRRFGDITTWEYRGIRRKPEQTKLTSVPIVPIVPISSTSILPCVERNENNRNNGNNGNIDETYSNVVPMNFEKMVKSGFLVEISPGTFKRVM